MDSNQLQNYVNQQINYLFPVYDANEVTSSQLDVARERAIHCVAHIKEWGNNGFDPLVSWQYASFIYLLSRVIIETSNDRILATRLFLLNKAINGIELFYEIEFPPVFFLSHTLGTVLSKAIYGEKFIIHQGCTVGRNKMDRPTIKDNVVLLPHSSIIGKCIVGENTVITPGVQLINTDSPGNCYVFSKKSGRVKFKEIDVVFSDRYFY
jgi:serine O-acetyltransferase